MKQHSLFAQLRAGSVHLFTSMGVVAGFLALLAVADHRWQAVALWLGVAQIIDGIDGTFARRWRVKEVLPNWDGRSIDYVVDFTTYAVVPAYFMYEAALFPPVLAVGLSAAVLLTSAMYYGKDGMVSDDFYFVGFPVMWNAAAVYLFFVVDWTDWANAAFVAFLCALHFVPIKFPYPSRTALFSRLTIVVSALLVLSCAMAVYQYPNTQPIWQWLAIAAVLYYLLLGLYVTFKTR
ncbi:MAG: phosphatidylcholine synthase [Sphingobacteriales bacterium]|nr:phosphatidylcholine synthase [Sphingobacteriales bacterium]MCC7222979.1 hypothetical protein [Chitinophagales bacterium]